MSADVWLLLIGALFVGVGLLGGGIEIKEIKIPNVGILARFGSLLIGFIFIAISISPLLSKVLTPTVISNAAQPATVTPPVSTSVSTNTTAINTPSPKELSAQSTSTPSPTLTPQRPPSAMATATSRPPTATPTVQSPTPEPTPKLVNPSLTPDIVVRLYYQMIDSRQFNPAYDMLSNRYKSMEAPLSRYAASFSQITDINIRDISVAQQKQDTSTVFGTVERTQGSNGRATTEHLPTTIDLVVENGAWKIDKIQRGWQVNEERR